MNHLNRRSFLHSTLAATTALGALQQSAQAQNAGDKPNVLFIPVDDLNDWIGCLGGHPQTRTPNLDRLAGQGVLFKNAFCSAPACNPSRASLLTGVAPATSGVYYNNTPWRPKLPDVVTLPGHFKRNGYLVKGRGKIFHGAHSKDEAAFHEYIPRVKDPGPPNKPVNGIPNTAHFDWGPVDLRDEEMDDYKIAAWAEKFLHEKHTRPFFLATGLFRPHLPWYVPRKYFDMFPLDEIILPNINENDLDDVPEAAVKMAKPDGDHRRVTETGNWRKAVQGYLASIAFCDSVAGKIVKALETSPYAENTIIVLWGDHGWHLGEKLHWRKFALWEEATHCPLMISTPDMRRNGTGAPCERTVTLLDLYPTLCDLCGLDKPGVLEGHSLQPLLKNPQQEWPHYALTTYGYKNHTIRSEEYRYIQYADGSEELYDEQLDPMEWTNLAGQEQYRDIQAELKEALPTVNAPGRSAK